MTEEIICPGCGHCNLAVTDEHFICGHPVFGKRGKTIYPETFKVLKKLGCKKMVDCHGEHVCQGNTGEGE